MVTEKKTFNPYPGLRPFNSNEGAFFFGREIQIRKAIDKVIKQRFVALIGSSGSGKSSFINAGIIPGIADFNDSNSKTTWRVMSARPGNSPIDNLAMALAVEGSKPQSAEDIEAKASKFSGLMRKNTFGLIEVLRRKISKENEKILLVIDQFEDLFRFKRSRNNKTNIHEFDVFIKLITEAQKQTEVPVHIIISVRSDFLDECQVFKELNHLINDSNFFLPKISTDDLMEIISKPAILAGGEVDIKLQQRLINDVRDHTDQLPLLQHLLSRMWDHWMRQNKDNPLSLANYEAVGRIDNALNIHADEAYQELSGNSRLVCERMFKALTEKGTGNSEITIPTKIADLAYIARVNVSEIIQIVERFRQPDRSFLLPEYPFELTSETIIDLAHESLMRLWSRLKKWIDDESSSVIMYQRLAEASRLYQIGKAELWTNPELEQALQWQDKNEPTFQWAQRYNTAFERTMQFLSRSKEAQYMQEVEAQISSRRKLRNTRIFAGFLVLLVMVSAYLVLHYSGLLPGSTSQPDLATLRPSERDNSALVDNIIREVEQSINDSPASAANRLPADTPGQLSQTVPGGNNSATPVAPVTPPANTAGQPERTETPTRLQEPAPVRNDPVSQATPEPATTITQPRQQAETVNTESLNRAMLSVSASLAIRSQQIEGDSDLKALLALQSHVFNEKYHGLTFNPDIYTGLFTSVRSLYGSNYNVYRGHSESVNSVVFRPNSTLFYSASSDGRVLQWDINDESRTPRVLIQNQVVNNRLAISPNGQWLAVATDGQGVLVFNPTRNQINPFQVDYGNNRIIALDFYPDNDHIVFAGSDNSIVKFNVRNNNTQVIGRTDAEVMSLSVSPNGRLIAAGTRAGQVVLFNEDNLPERQVIHNDAGNDILAVRFNHNGSRLAAGNIRGEVRIINTGSGNLVATLRGHSARVVDIAFCPNNTFIATTSFDGTVQLWNSQNLNLSPVILRDHGSWVRTVAFNSDGSRMVSGSRQESRLILWTTNPGDMASMICDRLSRNITREEWNIYIGEDIPFVEPCSQLSNR